MGNTKTALYGSPEKKKKKTEIWVQIERNRSGRKTTEKERKIDGKRK